MKPAEIAAHIEHVARMGGPGAWMRNQELLAGRWLVKPGSVPWLPAEDWDDGCVISVDADDRVRLVALAAKRPGRGAFKRLVALIRAAGLSPVVVTPTDRLAAHLKRRGWRMRVTGSGETAQTIWYPRRSRG